MKQWLDKNKVHIFYVTLLLLIVSVVYRENIIHIKGVWVGHDMFGLYYFSYKLLRDSLLTYGQFPFWSSTHMGGFPFFAYPQMMVLYPTTLLALLIPKTEVLLNIILLSSIFAGGIFMYFVLLKFKLPPEASFIGSLLFTFNGFSRWMTYGWLGRLNAYILFPLIFYFLWKALYSKKWLRYSLLTGLCLALQYYSSGVNIFMYSLVLFISVFAVFMFPLKLPNKLIKAVIIGVSILLVLFIFILPQQLQLYEFTDVSSQRGFTLKGAIGSHAKITNPFDYIELFLFDFGWASTKIGFVGFIFLIFSFKKYHKKKYFLALSLLLLLAILIGTGTKAAYYPLWKFVPGFDRMHHVNRAFCLFGFSASFLAALGSSVALKNLRTKIRKPAFNLIYGIIILLIVIELGGFVNNKISSWELKDADDMFSQNELLQYLSEQPGIFRVHNFNTHSIAGQASSYIVAKDLQMLYGVTSVWIPEYFNIYLGVSHRLPAKFWGMLNTKYIYSNESLNVNGLKFVNKFRECVECVEDKGVDRGVSGPYLYENEFFLPRAYATENAILIVGEKDNIRQIMYALMLSPNFNPANTVIISGDKKTVDQYEESFLNKFKAIILTTNSINDRSIPLLKRFVDKGGKLFPNILDGENQIDPDQIGNMLISFDLNYADVDELEHLYFSHNKQEISLRNKGGFLVLADKFYMFESWKAGVDGKPQDFLQANGANSAFLIPNGAEKAVLRYRPSYFVPLIILMILALSAILAYLIYSYNKEKLP